MTSYAFAADQYRLAGFFVKFDGLMSAIHARNIASAASVAEVIIEYREEYEEDGVHVKAYVPRALAAKRELTD